MSNIKEFIEARTKAEGNRQVAMSAARRTFEAVGAPDGQRAYDAAIRGADRTYFEAVIAAAEKFGIDPASYRTALANLLSGAATV